MGTPVKIYKSSDTDAPQITGGRGDVKTVLKACLVAGYGTAATRKEPLGWEIVAGTESADGFNCAFRPTAADSGKNIIHIAGANTLAVTLTAYFDTDINGALVNPSPAMAAMPTFKSGGVDWMVVGHHKSFILIIRIRTAPNLNEPLGAQGSALFFGELENRINNPRGNTLLMRMNNGLADFSNYYQNLNDFWLGKYSYVSQSIDGKDKWVQIVPNAIFKTLSVGYSPINSEMIYTKIGMSQGSGFRGFLPFGYYVHHRLPASDNYTYKNIDGINYLLCNCVNGSLVYNNWGENTLFMLINLDEWDI